MDVRDDIGLTLFSLTFSAAEAASSRATTS